MLGVVDGVVVLGIAVGALVGFTEGIMLEGFAVGQ